MGRLDPRLGSPRHGRHAVVMESRDTYDVSARWEVDDPHRVVAVKEQGCPHADTTRSDGLPWVKTHNAVHTVAGRTVQSGTLRENSCGVYT